MSRAIHFRCKTPSGLVQINNLTSEDRLLDLKTALSQSTGIGNLKVLCGYPPKELDLSKETALLGNYFKSNRESLTVSENKGSKMKGNLR